LEQEVGTIGVEAYVYLYPLLLMDITRRQMTNLEGGIKPGFGPVNAFQHVREFPPAEFRAVVRPNFDTLYSIAWLDLSDEPMVVSVPDAADRYYLLPMLDMWTDVFAVPGKRTTGTGAASYAIAPPGWEGETPTNVEVIEAPTPTAWVIGRTQTNGPADYAAVNAMQDGISVVSLSAWGSESAPVSAVTDATVDMETDPLTQVNSLSAADFFRYGSELMKLHPPHHADWSQLARMRRIGFGLDPSLQDALAGVPQEAQTLMQAKLPTLARVVNGWQMNTDTMGVYGNYYLKRAIVAMAGLGANPPEDAVYPLAFADADGQPLDGDHDYVLHFEKEDLPPVNAFWSVTMYDAEGFQVANEINRFAIGDRDELSYNTDGSLNLYLQHEAPAKDRASNWLPAPRGPLGVTMRLYAPRPEALDGRWTPPPIRRA
jgi:hypothetical protein